MYDFSHFIQHYIFYTENFSFYSTHGRKRLYSCSVSKVDRPIDFVCPWFIDPITHCGGAARMNFSAQPFPQRYRGIDNHLVSLPATLSSAIAISSSTLLALRTLNPTIKKDMLTMAMRFQAEWRRRGNAVGSIISRAVFLFQYLQSYRHNANPL